MVSPHASGMLIVLEGLDGCGKSTQVDRLVRWLRGCQSLQVIQLREPGGTRLGEQLREMMLGQPVTPLAETLLFSAARAELVETVVKPALTSGKTVVMDRFWPSTIAYQQYGNQTDPHLTYQLTRPFSTGLDSLILWLDVPVQTCLARVRKPDLIESRGVGYFERVRAGYQWLADTAQIVRVDGDRDPDSVAQQLRDLVALALINRRIEQVV